MFSILLTNLGSHKYFSYKPHKLSWVLSQILPIIFHILSNLSFHKNTYHITTKIEPQNYTISTKRPKLIYLAGKTQKSPTKPSKSLLLYGTSKSSLLHGTLKPTKSSLLHGTLKPVATRHL